MDTTTQTAGYYRSPPPNVPPTPSWWSQIWRFARSTPSLRVNSEAHAQAQYELQQDLTGLVLAGLARCSGLELSELQRSPALQQWIQQHLQPVTHHTPEWLQFVALVGAKKLSHHFGLYPAPPRTLDPSQTMETLPIDVDTDAVTTTPVSDDEPQDDPAMEAPNHPSADMVVDGKPDEPTEAHEETTQPSTHVTFESVPEETIVLPDPNAKKRKRTATPRPPRTVDLPPVDTAKTKKTKKDPDATRPPKPRAPRAPRTRAVKTVVSDPAPDDDVDPLLALPEIVVP